MKSILIIAITLITLKISAQPPAPGSYVTNPELDKFVGTWKAVTSRGDSMTIVLQKQKVHLPLELNYDEDMIVGWHSIKSRFGGTIIESSLINIGTQLIFKYNENMKTLLGGNQGSNEIYFTSVHDITKNKSGEAWLKLLPGSLTQATWRLINSRGIKPGGYDWSFTIPENLVFTKQ